MGLVRNALTASLDFVKEEILPLRSELIKAGLIAPDNTAYDQKASLVDPWSYGQSGYGFKEKYALLDYSKCRQVTYADPIVAAVIQTRLNQVAAFCYPQTDKYKMGFKISMRDREKKPGPGDKKRIKEIETFITHTGVPEDFDDTPDMKKRDNFESFVRKITRDSLTFDQINFEVTPRNDGRPYAFTAVDAATMRVIPDKKEEAEKFGGNQRPGDSKIMVNAFNDRPQGFRFFEPKSPKYAQVINGVVRHVFDEWEMAFGIRNPRTDITAFGYGFSEVEMLVTTITSHMNAETYNRKFFSQGSSIKGILTFEGGVPPDQLEAFRRQWYQQVTGVNNAWRTPIMSLGKDGKLNWQSLHSNNREMEFGKWLEYCIKTICGVFQIDPIEIGFDISKQGSGQSGSGGGGLGNGNQAERVAFSQDKGLRPLLVHIQNLLNEYIVFRLDPNYQLEFVGLNQDSENDALDRAVKQVSNFKTINEIRAEHDLPPLKKDLTKNLGDLVLNSNLVTAMGQAAQAEAGAEQPDPAMDAAQEGAAGPKAEAPGDQEEEPDYDNMSMDELQGELDKLQGGGEGKQGMGMEGKPGEQGGELGNADKKAKPGAEKPKMGMKPKAPQSPMTKSERRFYKELDL